MTISLFDLNPAIDVGASAARFAVDRRVQIRDLLTADAAAALHQVLARETPWGLGWRAGDDGPHGLEARQLAAMSLSQRSAASEKVFRAMQGP
ncbi:hypothetical protein [Sphingomonas bacterium]|uniref:hypothetical protein n=1 Tax=Sphingomonas bacterium TaxID=1895847 RepID=UPI00261EF9D3|nr:hypothetical protein [Sphingomonas bacterium]